MDEVKITRSVEVDASAEDVWPALTDPTLLGDWLDADVELDIGPAGRGRLIERDGVVRTVEVEEVTEARRVTFRWSPEDGSGPASVVRFDLEEAVGSTRVIVTETLVPAPGGPTASAVGSRWTMRLVLLGCYLLRAPVACG